MREDWLKEIQRKALMYTCPPPEADRARLERLMAEAAARGRRRMVAVWTRRLVAAAAVAALAVPLARLTRTGIPTDDGRPTTAAVSTAGHGAAAEAESLPRPLAAPAAERRLPLAQALNAAARPQAASCGGTAQPDGAPAEADGAPAQTAAATAAEPQPQGGSRPETAAGAMRRHAAATLPTAGRRHKRPLLASAFVANGLQQAGSATAAPAILPLADPIGEYSPQFSAGNSDPTLAQAEPARTDVSHRPPLRAGLSVSLPLGRRWAVESGLVYSFLYSEITSGGEGYATETTQRLHYVGVPLAVSYTVWQSRRIAVYAKAGGMVEKMVAGRADTRNIIDGEVESETDERVSIGPLQLSVAAAVGAEWRFADRLGAYIEPGLSYSFDNGSSVPTVYADRPLAFSLSLGLRLDVGRRAGGL